MRPQNKKIKLRQYRPPLILKVAQGDRSSDATQREVVVQSQRQIKVVPKGAFKSSTQPATLIPSRGNSRKNSPMNPDAMSGGWFQKQQPHHP